jgi:predicted Zn-dependent protease
MHISACRKLKESQNLLFVGICMRRFLLLFLLVSSLFLVAVPFREDAVQGQNQDQYSLQLQGFVWHRTTLSALVVTPSNEVWWNPVYLNATLRAIGQWNDAIAGFAVNYADFAYLSTLRMESTVSNVTQGRFDIYINWTDSSLSNASDEIGLSRIISSEDSTIINCTINLSVHDNHGSTINEVDMQNVALHELGHSLGLGHSNYTGDLMYAFYSLVSPAEEVSTLDAYGVATVFAWETNSSNFHPVSGWLKVNSVILPSYITYKDLPGSPQNASPQTLGNNPVVEQLVLIVEFLLHPVILAVVVALVVFFVIVGLLAVRMRRVSKAGS